MPGDYHDLVLGLTAPHICDNFLQLTIYNIYITVFKNVIYLILQLAYRDC